MRVEQTEAFEHEERWFVGLRLAEGVAPAGDDWERHGAALNRFLADGLLERAGERLRLTPRGILLSNEVFEEFLAPCP